MREPCVNVTLNDVYNEVRAMRKEANTDRAQIRVNTWMAGTSLAFSIIVLTGVILL